MNMWWSYFIEINLILMKWKNITTMHWIFFFFIHLDGQIFSYAAWASFSAVFWSLASFWSLAPFSSSAGLRFSISATFGIFSQHHFDFCPCQLRFHDLLPVFSSNSGIDPPFHSALPSNLLFLSSFLPTLCAWVPGIAWMSVSELEFHVFFDISWKFDGTIL